MKTRQGFVSNSSSSSYIVKIGMSYENFIAHLASEYKWQWFSKKSILGTIRECIKNLKSMLADHKSHKSNLLLDPDGGWRKNGIQQLEEHIVELEELIDKINDIDNKEELVSLILAYWDIKVDSIPQGVAMSYYTSMHNDYNDGMIPIMRELVLHFMFDTPYRVICKREKDDSAS